MELSRRAEQVVENGPMISVLVPAYQTPERWLRRCIDSVLAQVYPKWQLCLADDASPDPGVMRVLREYAARDSRINVMRRERNGHISEASNSALELARGEYVALLDHDDELRPHALLEMAEAIAATSDVGLLYSDEDKIDGDGRRFDPYFKPDWDPDLLRSQNYICHLTVIRTDLVRAVGGFRKGFEGSQDHDLILRCTERLLPSQIVHIPKVLYHWRAIPGSTALSRDAKDYAASAGVRAVAEQLSRCATGALAEELSHGHYRVRWPLPESLPKVSLVIPTRDKANLLRQCIDSILQRSTYNNFEILIVDNGSSEPDAIDYLASLKGERRIRVLRYDKPFNYSAINNWAVSQCDGEVIGLVNNDIEVITPDWLEEMVSHAVRTDVGAVGAMLYYPGDTIQHAGVVLGIHGVAAHVYGGLPRGYPGHGGRARVAQGLSAVTGACLLVLRDRYELVGGLDERLAVAFNDIDFCLRLRQAGFRNVWTPFAELYHHESASRGAEDTEEKRQRFSGEIEFMCRRWGTSLQADPAYNVNLSLDSRNFELSVPPRSVPVTARPGAVGEATLTETQGFTGGTTINAGALTVAGTLETPTVVLADDTALNVGGTLQGNGGGYASITGSAGVNTVTVAEGALLQGNGDLGGGDDVLDVAGALDSDGGVFRLGDGDDMFVVHDTTVMLGTVDGGLGNDMLNVNVSGGNTVPLGSLLGFESLGKSGDGTLQINGPSEFIDVDVFGGVLEVSASGSVAAQNTAVASGATLQVDGAYTGTAGNDTLTVAGMVTGSGTVALGDGNDSFTIQDGADLSGLLTPVDGGAGTDTFNADIAGEATLGGAINFETLTKTNTGTLHVDGPAPSAFATVIVDSGTLDVGTDGSLDGVQSTYVAMGATLNVDGSFSGSDGDDVMEVAGTVMGNGIVALGDGDDQLVLMEGADLGGLANALDGGAGTDTVQSYVDTTMVLGPTVNFETLDKGGNGELIVAADQGFVTTTIDQGTLTVADGVALSSQNTTVNVGAILDVQGAFTGTDGDDTFVSMGTVNGALSFGAGDDAAHFIGGDLSGLTGVDGGAGSADVLRFSALNLEDDSFDPMTGWERVELLGNSSLTLGSALDLAGGTLFIDNTSLWTANDGASLAGSVENAGRIDVGTNRMAISGNYTGGDGLLQVTVSPANGTSGGLDIVGNVSGTTGVIFASDGTDVTQPTNILVISAPNAAAGAFVPAQPVDGFVRLEGSVYPWTFEQSGMDHNWYLGTDGGGVLPEIPGYAVLPTVGALMAQQGDDLAHQRLAGVRGTDRPECGPKATAERAGAGLVDDCNGFWVAAATNELELGANPGFELSGDDVGLYVGFDQALDRNDRVLRFGGYLGLLHANYWTSGVNSTDLPGVGESEIDMDTPVAGLYFSNRWANGAYVDVVWSGQRPRAYVRTADGFHERLVGNSLTLSTRAGWRYALQGGWVLEPQVQVEASQVHWQDTVDAAGRSLAIDDDVVSSARAGLRVEKAFETAGGASIRPWAMLAVQDAFGENATSLQVTTAGPNATPQLFPNHDRGLATSLDVGVEATLNKKVSLFGVVSLGQDLEGTDYEHRAANAGIRVRW
ncbi:hypothetical protein GCM10027084_01410 [Pseudoxanthomonas sangjuensis]